MIKHWTITIKSNECPYRHEIKQDYFICMITSIDVGKVLSCNVDNCPKKYKGE